MTIVVIALLAIYFGPSEFRKAEMDKEVERLCATDSGVKIFEYIPLSEDQFKQGGYPRIPPSGSVSASNPAYVLENKSTDVVLGDPYGLWRPTLHRFAFQIVRSSDGKIMGQAVSYGRSGGDADSPGHPSHYDGSCMQAANELEHIIFKVQR
ncbi:MAG: hypothetical protein JSS40_13645 [Proteobacteria bacterium]|nr:hypothetical protein [Pseudomonadota bacterium]